MLPTVIKSFDYTFQHTFHMSHLYVLSQKFVHINFTAREKNTASLWTASKMFLQSRDFKVPYLYRNVAGTSITETADEEEHLLLLQGWYLRSSELLLSVN